jgi:hypothetical protein
MDLKVTFKIYGCIKNLILSVIKVFSSDQQISSVFSKIFENKICQTWSKQLINEDLGRL